MRMFLRGAAGAIIAIAAVLGAVLLVSTLWGVAASLVALMTPAVGSWVAWVPIGLSLALVAGVGAAIALSGED